MNAFKVTYTDGTSYETNANGTLAEFTAYLMQFGGVVTDENPVTGKETRRYIEKIEQIDAPKKYQIIKAGNAYRADEIIGDVGYFSHHCGNNVTALVAELEAMTPKPEVTFDTASRLDFYRSL